MKNTLADYLTAACIACFVLIGAMEYFDVLTLV